ncbi:hypothetical protein ROZALSC1DRAFT_25251 [Rozella allomycis CSF55]|uniref:Uncharacterized protein n=1 Tax=Rozella allomycis (strain CSF55) TaxID=988480 RepID=A0A4P9YE20_ROZAC|nr:hypothetical protein ROZALSC1DRAFT_25251 [Rozella allomycis CSF55]
MSKKSEPHYPGPFKIVRRNKAGAKKLHSIAISITTSAAFTILATVASDGRSHRSKVKRKFSTRITPWHVVQRHVEYFEGWFVDRLRCNRRSFDKIVDEIEKNWRKTCFLIGKKAYFKIREHVAATSHYLAHGGTVTSSAKIFGMSQAVAFRAIRNILQFIKLEILSPKPDREP